MMEKHIWPNRWLILELIGWVILMIGSTVVGVIIHWGGFLIAAICALIAMAGWMTLGNRIMKWDENDVVSN